MIRVEIQAALGFLADPTSDVEYVPETLRACTESVVGSVFAEEMSAISVDIQPVQTFPWGEPPWPRPTLTFLILVDHDEMMHDPGVLADQFRIAMNEMLQDCFNTVHFEATIQCIGATVACNQPERQHP